MEKIKSWFLKLLDKFQKLSSKQKIFIIVFPLLLTFLLLFIIYFSLPRYDILFSNLDFITLNRIEYELSKLGIDYKIDFNKGIVYVPEDKVKQLRLFLAEKGIISPEHKVGFEIFKNPPLTISDFAEQINYLKALETELEKTIESIEAIEEAKVNIALPRNSIFSRPEEEPRASVLIKLRPGYELTPEQIKAIRNLVVASVVGLKPQNVVIVDQYGRDLTSLIGDESDAVSVAKHQLLLKLKYEKKLERDIEKILTSIVGPGNAKVKVSLWLDFRSVETKKHEVNPDKTAIVSQQKEKKQKKTLEPAGVPGAESNIPPGKGKLSISKTIEQEKKSITNYEISYIDSLIKDPTVKIKRISIGVVLNSNIPKHDAEKIKKFLISALGLNPKRGDTISVVVLPFKGKTVFSKYFTNKSKSINYYLIIILIIISLVLIILILWTILKIRKDKSKEQLEVYGKLVGAPPGAAIVSQKTEESLIKRLSRLAEENPTLYKKILLSWLKETS